MINLIERSSVKLILFSESKLQHILRDVHPFRPEIRERKKPRPKHTLAFYPIGDIMQSRFLF